MHEYETKMIEDMKLRGLLPRTQEAYLGVARLIVRHFDKQPEQISEEDLRNYFIYLAEEKKAAPSTNPIDLKAAVERPDLDGEALESALERRVVCRGAQLQPHMQLPGGTRLVGPEDAPTARLGQ